MFTSPNYSGGFALCLAVPLLGCCKRATYVGDNMTVPSFRVHLRDDGFQADWTCFNRFVRILLWVKVGSDGCAYKCFF